MAEVIQSLEYLGHSVSQELWIIDLLGEQSFLISWEARGRRRMGTEDCLPEDVGDGGGKFSRRQHSIRGGGGVRKNITEPSGGSGKFYRETTKDLRPTSRDNQWTAFYGGHTL